jgi:hypothetical protein
MLLQQGRSKLRFVRSGGVSGYKEADETSIGVDQRSLRQWVGGARLPHRLNVEGPNGCSEPQGLGASLFESGHRGARGREGPGIVVAVGPPLLGRPASPQPQERP